MSGVVIHVWPSHGKAMDVFRNVVAHHVETFGVIHMTLENGDRVVVKDYYRAQIVQVEK